MIEISISIQPALRPTPHTFLSPEIYLATLIIKINKYLFKK